LSEVNVSMRFLHWVPISRKIILSILPLFVLFIAVSVVLQNNFQERAMFDQARSSAATNADVLRESLVSMMTTNQEVDSTFLFHLNSIPRFDSVRIVVNDLRLREELLPAELLERRKYKDRAMAPSDSIQKRVLETGRARFLWSGDQFRGVIPFAATKVCQRCHAVPIDYTLGASDMSVSYSFLSEAAEENWKRSVLIFLVFSGLVAGVATMMFRRFVSTPIGRLNAAAERIGRGHLDEPVVGETPHADTRDELMLLSGRLDGMRRSLKEKLNEIDSANQDLSERNRQLEEALRELHQAQEDLLQSERLAATGRLSAQLSHEINNPIHNIQSLLESSSRRLPADSPAQELILTALEEISRLARLTRQMLEMYRGTTGQPEQEPVEIVQLVDEIAALHVRALETAGICLASEHHQRPLWVSGSRDKLTQVLINLLLNARDAQPGGGEIIIRTRRQTGRAVVEVADRGAGIPEDHLGRVFEAFFTTKKAVSGVGLGLTVCHGIVQQHGGTITVSSVLGEGTTFTVELPARKQNDDR